MHRYILFLSFLSYSKFRVIFGATCQTILNQNFSKTILISNIKLITKVILLFSSNMSLHYIRHCLCLPNFFVRLGYSTLTCFSLLLGVFFFAHTGHCFLIFLPCHAIVKQHPRVIFPSWSSSSSVYRPFCTNWWNIFWEVGGARSF